MTASLAATPVVLRTTRRKSAGFALTPLADVMFQLLLFFMLTSSLAPYALLPMGGPESEGSANRSQAQVVTDAAPAQAIWHLGHKEIRSGQVRIALDLLPQALEELRADDIRDLVVLVTQSAQVSDLAYLLEIAGKADLMRLQLVGG
jgi:biopolymer transport protein ExbD